jgi:acyl transferase domain-containing protein/acyl carrier protein
MSAQAGGAVQPIAVIGMAGRFPGAASVEAFWSNLRQGVHSIRVFTDDQLRAAGVGPEWLRDPAYVKAGGVLEGADLFDAAFFGLSPREAEVMDPQHRLLLETAWEALENAGYDPGTTGEVVGVYVGASSSDYLRSHVEAHPEVVAAVGGFQAFIANARDFLATRAAHKLNLRGPAYTVQTACSTGLVTIHVACQALAAGECDMAVAGGVCVNPCQDQGYPHVPGGIGSPDGVCRAFDQHAGGTVDGNGIALVVLKRLADALADGDTIRAVVLGTAINNDGSRKAGFTAPSVDGQAAAIEEALAMAGVAPETIGYVEAHGTGTELGDPVEVAALTQAFGATARKQFCALGALKTNVGHLDSAAGAAGFIKAALVVERGEIPPTLHFTAPNPRIDFASSPFFVNAELRPWPANGTPRRAGVSSFGLGGTNAHAVLEQPPVPAASEPARDWHLLVLSARTPEALEAATDRLAAHLRAHPEQPLADTAHTLQLGRRAFAHRRVLAARDAGEAAQALESRAPESVAGEVAPDEGRPAAFLFHGVGSQYAGMGRGVYASEPVYREVVDRCAELLRPRLGVDLREVLYAGEEAADEARWTHDTRLSHLAVFVTGYALARLWMHWGVRPRAMIGHSLGEYVAATVAGVWGLEDALMLVAERARLMDAMPRGAMLALGLGEDEVRPLLGGGLGIATLNGPAATVVSGPVAAVERLQGEMAARGVFCRRLPIRLAAHSSLMEPVAAPLAELLRGVRLAAPSIPFVSNVTGEWIRPTEATDPAYWARHLCSAVRFADGMATLAGDGRAVLLEVGPGHALRSLVSRLPLGDGAPPIVVTSLRHAYEERPDVAHLLDAAGRLWAAGVPVDWTALHAHERLRRVPLPTYPFERRRFWLDRLPAGSAPPAQTPPSSSADPAGWLYVPAWTRAPLPSPGGAHAPSAWLVLADGAGIGARLASRLEELGHTVAVVEAGEAFGRAGDRGYTVRPGSEGDLRALRDALGAAGVRPLRVVHLWGLGPDGEDGAVGEGDTGDEVGEGDEGGEGGAFARAQARGFATVAALAATFAPGEGGPPLRMVVVTEHARDVAGGEPVRPERATVLGACLALAHEPRVACRTVDVRPRPDGTESLVRQLLAEVTADDDDDVALRGPLRWARGFQPVRVPEAAGPRSGGAWLFCGAPLPGALALAERLAAEPDAHVAWVVDPAFPPRDTWDAYLAAAAEDDDARRVVSLVRAVEAAGGEVLLPRAAAGDAAGLRAALAEAREAFGRLDGVVHGVGVGRDGNGDDGNDGDGAEGAGLADAPPPEAVAELARAARELAALRDATAGVPPGMVVVWSDLASAVAGAGRAGPAAAGALAEAWVGSHAARGGEGWTSVAWDRWASGDGADADADGEPRPIRPAEGARVFGRLAALAGEPRVVVCTEPPAARRDRLRAAAPTPAEPGRAAANGAAPHPRPGPESGYEAPTRAAEEILAAIWRELLGVEQVGIRDDFFRLGGHSLLGLQVAARVREAFGVELSLRDLFLAPTIAALAERIDEVILAELDGMSDDEAAELIGGSAA